MHDGDERSGSRHRLHSGIAVGLLAAAGLAWFLYALHRAPVPPRATPAIHFVARDDALGMSIGKSNAPVVVREFADFECPACGGFEPVLGYMRKQYVDSGRVRFVFFDYPLTHVHPHAMLAAMVARCAGVQGRFWEMHDLLYQRQQDWAQADDASFNPMPRFTAYAQELKLDLPAWTQCLKGDAVRVVIKRSAAYGDRLGVYATPTFAVDSAVSIGGVEYPDLHAMIEAQLKNSGTPH